MRSLLGREPLEQPGRQRWRQVDPPRRRSGRLDSPCRRERSELFHRRRPAALGVVARKSIPNPPIHPVITLVLARKGIQEQFVRLVRQIGLRKDSNPIKRPRPRSRSDRRTRPAAWNGAAIQRGRTSLNERFPSRLVLRVLVMRRQIDHAAGTADRNGPLFPQRPSLPIGRRLRETIAPQNGPHFVVAQRLRPHDLRDQRHRRRWPRNDHRQVEWLTGRHQWRQRADTAPGYFHGNVIFPSLSHSQVENALRVGPPLAVIE